MYQKENIMKANTFAKVLILFFILTLTLSSCSFITEMKDEAQKASDFTNDFAALVQDPTLERAEELVHPSSPLTAQSVIDRIESNEKLTSLDPSSEIRVDNIGDIKMSYHDEELGGNVYTVDCDIIVGTTPISVTIIILSTSEGFGLYDFEIQ